MADVSAALQQTCNFFSCFAALFVFTGCGAKEATPAPGPPTVLVLKIEPQRLEVFDEITATLDGSANTEVRAQVSGYLLQQHYRDGSTVKPGDLLFEIDPLPFQAAVLKAQADVESALAAQIKAEQEESRNRQLIQANAVSRMELEASVMANSAAKAQVKALDAVLDRARLELGYTRVTSPIGGVAGSAIPGRGDLVNPNQVLTTISALDPIKARFTISENVYLKHAREITAANERAEGERRDIFELIRADGRRHPQRGRLGFIDRQVEASTGALAVTAVFPNPEIILRPGQYARVRLVAEALPTALAVPQRAVLEIQGRYLLCVVKADRTADLRPVRVGPRVGNLWVIEDGLQPGETVVVEGIQKCRAGQPVNPEPWTESSTVKP
jgi:membrane fusion protein (multidrug efflux system)